MTSTPRCCSPSVQRPGSSLSSYGHYGQRPSIASRSTALPPTRPGSSRGASRGPSQASARASTPSGFTSRGPSPLGSELLWHQDAPWPMREGGLAAPLTGKNSSVDVDLSLARRTLEAAAAAANALPVKHGSGSGKSSPIDWRLAAKATGLPTVLGSKSKGSAAPSPLPAKVKDQQTAGPIGMVPMTRDQGGPGHKEAIAQVAEAAVEINFSVKQEPYLITGQGLVDRPALVRWCFRRPREQIEGRLENLDSSSFERDHRAAVYTRHEGDPPEDSLIGKLLKSYEETTLGSLPPATHPAQLDAWPAQEGGCSKTSEILCALEVLNFHRWLCGVPRLLLDDFLQDVVDVILQALKKRDERPLSKVRTSLEAFSQDLEDFTICQGLDLAIVSQVPSASTAMRLLFSGLPSSATCDRGPSVIVPGRVPEVLNNPQACLALAPYACFLRHGAVEEGGSEASESSARPSPGRFRRRAQFVSDGHPNALPAAPGRPPPPGEGFNFVSGGSSGSESRSKWRKMGVWGDTKGVVALRRRALDPRLRRVGLLRRGCTVCLWASPRAIKGLPPEAEDREIDDLADDFLDPDVVEEPVVSRQAIAQGCPELQILQQWRQAATWLNDKGGPAKGSPGGSDCGDQHDNMPPILAKLSSFIFDPSQAFNSEVSLPFARHKGRHLTAGGLGGLDATTRTEMYIRSSKEALLKGEDGSQLLCSSTVDETSEATLPVMVCYPPPGIVPIECIDEAEFMPWTISPDPLRLMPTSECRVQVFRVKVDLQRAAADRLPPGEELPLSSFCVDCGNVGTSFCVTFALDLKIRAGDQFEVVLSGLSDRIRGGRAACSLSYIVSFESFQPSRHRDTAPELKMRSAALLKDFSAKELWEEASWFFPRVDEFLKSATPEDEKADAKGKSPRKAQAQVPTAPPGSPKRGGLKRGFSQSQGTKEEQIGQRKSITVEPQEDPDKVVAPTAKNVSPRPSVKLRFSAEADKPKLFDAKHPPPIGIVNHAMTSLSTSKLSQGLYCMRVQKASEVVMAFIVPCNMMVKATLQGFVKSQSRWEVVPHAVYVTCFDELPSVRTISGGLDQQEEKPTTASRKSGSARVATSTRSTNSEMPEPGKDPEQNGPPRIRLIVRIMIPMNGHYELKFHWGIVPCKVVDVANYRGLSGLSMTPFEHPLRVQLYAPAGDDESPYLVPSMLHSSLSRFGYPAKHPLAEHFGVTLLHPMRHRLKRLQQVRFIVHSHQVPLGDEAGASFDGTLVKLATPPASEKVPVLPQNAAGHRGGDIPDDDLDPMQRTPSEFLAEPSVQSSTPGVAPVPVQFTPAETVRQRIRSQLGPHIRCGVSEGQQLCVAAVIGNWQRVEMLSRRRFAPDGASHPTKDKAFDEEVHELVLQLATQETGLVVQLVVFQVRADLALESEVALRSLEGRSDRWLSPNITEPGMLGLIPRPSYWILAEFLVDSGGFDLPFDEEEMARAPPGPISVADVMRRAHT